jgi:hypothetical protein
MISFEAGRDGQNAECKLHNTTHVARFDQLCLLETHTSGVELDQSVPDEGNSVAHKFASGVQTGVPRLDILDVCAIEKAHGLPPLSMVRRLINEIGCMSWACPPAE